MYMCNRRIVFEDETDKKRLCFNHAVSAVFLGHKIEAQIVDIYDDVLGRVCEAGGHAQEGGTRCQRQLDKDLIR